MTMTFSKLKGLMGMRALSFPRAGSTWHNQNYKECSPINEASNLNLVKGRINGHESQGLVLSIPNEIIC